MPQTQTLHFCHFTAGRLAAAHLSFRQFWAKAFAEPAAGLAVGESDVSLFGRNQKIKWIEVEVQSSKAAKAELEQTIGKRFGFFWIFLRCKLKNKLLGSPEGIEKTRNFQSLWDEIDKPWPIPMQNLPAFAHPATFRKPSDTWRFLILLALACRLH